MLIPPALPPFHETVKAEVEHRRSQARPGSIVYDLQWAFWAMTFPVRAFVSWRRKRRQKRNAWAQVRRPDRP